MNTGQVVMSIAATYVAAAQGMNYDENAIDQPINDTPTISSNMANIYVEDNVLCEQDPRFIPASTDMPGLVAEQSVILADNAANQTDCTIQGNIFARSGSLTAQNYDNGVLRGRGLLVASPRAAFRP